MKVPTTVLVIFTSGFLSDQIHAREKKSSNNGAALDTGLVCAEDGPAAHPTKCDYYYDCWKGTANVGRCPMSMLFNEEKFYCDYPANVNCGARKISGGITEMENECPYSWGLFPNLEDCSTYYHCSRGRKINMASCPNGLLFDPDQLTCNWPERVNCRGSKKPKPMFDCPSTDGYFANPEDCKKLFLCQKGEARMLGCSTGESYDSNLQRCVPSIHGCSRPKQEVRRTGDDNKAPPGDKRRPTSAKKGGAKEKPQGHLHGNRNIPPRFNHAPPRQRT